MNKLKNLILFIFLIIGVFNSYAQKEANIWYFGNKAGLDFNSGAPVSLTDGLLNTVEGCATISNSVGNLMFYTDGSIVYNKNHQVMYNGTGLLGHSSSTNSALIVPKPNDPNIYYIFTVDQYGESNGFRYSKVDMRLNGGLGGIMDSEKNIFMLSGLVSEKVTAVKHSNNKDFWVLSHKFESDEFVAFLISQNGINFTPVVSKVGRFIGGHFNSAIGTIKISPNGKKIAVANGGYSYYVTVPGDVEIFDFDTTTGKVTNPITIYSDNTNIFVNPIFYGLEFSPDSNYLYATELRYYSYTNRDYFVYQFDLQAGSTANVIGSKAEIYKENRGIGAMQLAADGKIYVSVYENDYLDVINNPNEPGLASNYQSNAIYLGGRRAFMGLPQFIQSYFDIKDIIFEEVCFGDATKFSLADTVDAVVWDFGDPASGLVNTSTNFESTHLFTTPGDYEVSVTATLGANTVTKTATVSIYERPVAHTIPDQVFCDYQQAGEMIIEMSVYTNAILNGQDANLFSVTFYDGVANYNNNIPMVNDQFNLLTLATADPVASVKHKNNPDCEAITTIHVSVLEGPNPNQNIIPLTICDNTGVGTNNDGIIQFDLTQKETEILNGQLSIDFTVSYFTDLAMLNEIINPLQYENISALEKIYVQVTNNTNRVCLANTTFDIEVLELPTVNTLVELKQCDDDLDGFSAFNLNEVINKITVNATNETITFHESQLEALSNSSPIANTSNYTNQIVSSDIIWARVENANGCYNISEINLIVSTTQIPESFIRDFYKCDDDLNDGDSANGVSTFDFSSVTAEIEIVFPAGQQSIINYYRNQSDALTENNPIVDISNYRNEDYPNTQNIFIRVDSGINNDCIGLGHHITLHVEKQPIAYPVTISEECDADGDDMFEFDTSNLEAELLNSQVGMQITYFDEQGNVLPSPLPNPFLTGTQSVRAVITNASSQDSNGKCADETILEFIVDAAVVVYPVSDLINCDVDNDGMFEFDTSTIEAEVLNGQTGMLVFYTDASGSNLSSPLPNPLVSASQEITVRVENPLSNVCYDETTFQLVIVEQPILNMSDTWLICEGDAVDIVADVGYDEYVWSTGETTRAITVFSAGTYVLTATNVFNGVRCETNKTLTVVESNVAIITDIETEDWTANDNVITVFVEGSGDYEYSLDGITYQDGNQFANLDINNYRVYVRDKKGCGIVTKEVFLMFYPKFFTPNSDGYHDTWNIYNSSLEPNNRIFIYDRYGKLVKQLSPLGDGWNGTYNGKLMPSNDYWFVVERQNGKRYTGHFTLKR